MKPSCFCVTSLYHYVSSWVTRARCKPDDGVIWEHVRLQVLTPVLHVAKLVGCEGCSVGIPSYDSGVQAGRGFRRTRFTATHRTHHMDRAPFDAIDETARQRPTYHSTGSGGRFVVQAGGAKSIAFH